MTAAIIHVLKTGSMRVLLVEDSFVLADRIGELIHRLPRIDLIGTVDTEAEAAERIAAAPPPPREPAATEGHHPPWFRPAAVSARGRDARRRCLPRQIARLSPAAGAAPPLRRSARQLQDALTLKLRAAVGPPLPARERARAAGALRLPYRPKAGAVH